MGPMGGSNHQNHPNYPNQQSQHHHQTYHQSQPNHQSQYYQNLPSQYQSQPSQQSQQNQVAQWLAEAGLQKYNRQLVAANVTEATFRKLRVQDYARLGVNSDDDKQKLFRLINAINGVRSSGPDQVGSLQTNYPRSASLDAFLTASIFDVHSIEDTELLAEQTSSRSTTSSKGGNSNITEETGVNDNPMMPLMTISPPKSATCSRSTSPLRDGTDSRPSSRATSPLRVPPNQLSTSHLNPLPPVKPLSTAKIKVVVRKRPLNRREISRREDDVISISNSGSLMVHEPKTKVDLTKYVEKHEFTFDAVLDEDVSNDEVYRETVEPIVPYIFQKTKATCFAYGQTGSGKTYTMQPLPLRAAKDMLQMLELAEYRSHNFQLWVSFFEIYGGKLYDLLNDRKKLPIREDARQQVCIVGLKEHRVENVKTVKDLVETGGAARTTGSTGANEESSRSHAILQLVVKKHKEPENTRMSHSRRSLTRQNEDGESGAPGRLVGKFSFIDLAGSERGADTVDNDKQTRMEGAEINKSLLALKECIRALDQEAVHIPFRGSKLTEVLRDSFVGNSRTVMVSCISPGAASVEHTLNTLRYADRVKGLSKGIGATANVMRSSGLALRESNSTPLPPLPPSLGPYSEQETSLPDYVTDRRTKHARSSSGSVIHPLENTDGKVTAGRVDGSDVDDSEVEVESGTEEIVREPRRSGLRSSVRKTRYQGFGLSEGNEKGTGDGKKTSTRGSRVVGGGGENSGGFLFNTSGSGNAAVTNVTGNVTSGSYAANPVWPVFPGVGGEGGGQKMEGAEQVGNGGGGGGGSVPMVRQSLGRPGNGGSSQAFQNQPGSFLPPRAVVPKAEGVSQKNQESLVGASNGQRNSVKATSENRRREGEVDGFERLVMSDDEVTTREPRRDLRRSTRKSQQQQQMEREGELVKGGVGGGGGGEGGGGGGEEGGGEILRRRRASKENGTVSSIGSEMGRPNKSVNNGKNTTQAEVEFLSAHRKQIEETMEIVRQEVKLLARLEKPDSLFEDYNAELTPLLERKMALIFELQSRHAGFKRYLKEAMEASP